MGNLIRPGIRLRWKAGLILTKYYGRATAKQVLGHYPLTLFAISFGLFLIALVPSVRDQVRGSRLLPGATLLEITGTVSETISAQGQSVTRPTAGVQVEAGGFKTETAASGEYRLKIVSKEQQDIPVVFSHRGRQAISRVSFSATSRTAQKDFVFDR